MNKKYYLAKDGHKCDSKEEADIDDWLRSNDIDHSKPQKKSTKKDSYYSNKLWYPDWVIDGEHIEWLGLKGREDYDIHTEDKLNHTKKGKKYHFLIPYRGDITKAKAIFIDEFGNKGNVNVDYKTYLLRRFKNQKEKNKKFSEYSFKFTNKISEDLIINKKLTEF